MITAEVLDKGFNNISIRFSDKWARIVCDDYLFDFLNHQKGNSALKLAEYILTKYQELAGCPLQITKDSLTIEILFHVYMDLLSTLFLMSKNSIPKELYKKLEATFKEIKRHMDIIDCGELSVDTNRHVWDELEKYHKFIYKLYIAAKKIAVNKKKKK